MRKLGLLVTLAVTSLLFLAATPNPASAANCSPSTGQTYYASGKVQFSASLDCTTDVDQVQYDGWSGGPLIGFGWSDWSAFTFIWAQNSTTYKVPGPVPPHARVAVLNYFMYGCSLPGHYLSNAFSFRIHQTGGAWGPWHSYSRSNTQGIYPC